jgi:hypothetical protein
MKDIPRYKDLPEFKELDCRHSWDVFGRDDQLGRINLMTPETVLAAASEVKRGARFNLSLPLSDPEPSWSKNRKNYKHNIFSAARNSQDDYLDSFYMQRSTQWDGLRHVRAREFGFYGGRQAEQAGPGGADLGIEQWVRHGMVGRGVLVDVAGYQASIGKPIDARQAVPITVDMLEATLAHQKTALKSGDVMMLRTGYVDAYLKASREERVSMSEKHDCPGLHAGHEVTEFLWDSGIAAIAADNPAVEVVPGVPEVGSIHRRLIPLLGFALGEFFTLGEIAEDCRRDGRYTCMFVAVPLNVPGAVGSPGNAIAIK